MDRVNSVGRLNSGTKKLTDVEVLKDLRSRYELFRFDNHLGLTLDSTNTSPPETAKKILAFLEGHRPAAYSGEGA
jgi:hypothetical protein